MNTKNWKPLFGHYQISTNGEIRSNTRTIPGRWGNQLVRGKILSQTKDKDGYLCISLICEDERKTFKVHRLVAMKFLCNPENLPEVNHKNKIRSDNNVDNLEWIGKDDHMKLDQAKTYEFSSPENEKIVVFCISDFCRKHDLNRSNLCKVHNGKRKSHKGWSKWNEQ